MIFLLLGMLLFIGVHCLPMSSKARAGVVGKMGEGAYMGLFSLLSLLSIGLIVYGVPRTEFMLLWVAPAWSALAAKILLPIALYLVVAAQLPSKTRQLLIHPMLIGVGLWGLAHLVANGDVAGLLLFGGFFGYAVVALISLKIRGRMGSKPGAFWADGVAILIAAIATILLTRYHGLLFGVALG